MIEPLPLSAQKVQDALIALGGQHKVSILPHSTRTAQEAAQTLGCQVAQIAKSLIFRTRSTGRAVLVIASGSNRVNEKRLAELVGEDIERAAPEFVREQTGYAIGGIPPLGHAQALLTFIDQDLLQYSRIWAAAGTPNSIFELDPAELESLSGGQVVSIK